jgi:hypothetical protein
MPEAEEMKGLVILRGFLMRELRVDNSSSSFNLIFSATTRPESNFCGTSNATLPS